MNQNLRQPVPIADLAVVVNPEHDHAAVAKDALAAGTRLLGLRGEEITLRDEIPAGHRFAIRPVPAGEWVRQYGQPFAISKAGLQPGDPVNDETVESAVPQVDPDSIEVNPPVLPPWEGPLPVFQGFHRADGRVGTRNWILIVPTSNCSSHEAASIAMQAELGGVYSRELYPNVDGVTALPHTRGCGCPDMAPAGAGANKVTSIVEATMRLLAEYIRHPNVGGAILIELGCEKTNLSALNRFILGQEDSDATGGSPRPEGRVKPVRPVDLSIQYGKPVLSLSVQACGGTRATIQRGLQLLPGLLEEANRTARAPAPVSALAVGLECGGSDAFSGITANPALGYASDLLVRAGGSAVISEVPEFFGAEHLFAARAASSKVARQVFDLMQRYRNYAGRIGRSMSENPSPGNKEGGLLNITIKSLGAMAKGGTAPLQGVLDYGEPYWKQGKNGLFMMYGPGYDPESVPAMVASGCQIVCFTTGRGSVLGNAIAPVVKIASNSVMYNRMATDMDVNAGTVIDGTADLETVGRQIFEAVLAAASGKWTKAEENGHREFTIWSEEGISL
jgi:altronate hydrolase